MRLDKAVGALLRYGLPLIVSAGLCWILLRHVDLRENIEIVARYCRWEWIALALALSIFSNVLRALRWRIQLRALGITVPLRVLVYSFFGTYSVNLVLPRLGEVWRTGYVAHSAGASFSQVFGSMVSDRLADAATVLLIMLLALGCSYGTVTDYIASEPGRLERLQGVAQSPWLWTAAGVVIVGAWLLLWHIRRSRGTTRVSEICRKLWEGFIVIVRMPGLGRWLWLTAAVWGCYFLQLYVAFFAFDFTAQVVREYGAAAVLVCFALTSISMVLPSNGGYGPWQMAVVFGLSFYSAGVTVPAGQTFGAMSIGFANCVMTSQTLMLILLGLYTFAAIAIGRRRRGKAPGGR